MQAGSAAEDSKAYLKVWTNLSVKPLDDGWYADTKYSLNTVLLQEFTVLHRLERRSVVADYLGWEAVSCKEIAQGVAGCSCDCCLHWTKHSWPFGVSMDYDKVVVGMVRGEV